VTTLSDVVERTRRRLMTSMREPVNVLANPVDSDDTAWTFTYETKFTEGYRLSVDLEDVRVGPGGGTTTANVIRATAGTSAASHAQGALVHIAPTWTNFEIAQAVNDELADLSSPVNGLFRVRSDDFDFNPSTFGYELITDDFLSVWRVRYNVPGPENVWPVIPPSMLTVDNAADTGDFPSGVTIVLHEGGEPGHKVRVSYRAAFDLLPIDSSDDLTANILTATGLHTEAHDILSLGAAIRLLSGLEAQRAYATAQANPRRGDEVPPGSASRALAPLLAQREERIRAEKDRLLARYPEATR
jgi:hypothetical protein